MLLVLVVANRTRNVFLFERDRTAEEDVEETTQLPHAQRARFVAAEIVPLGRVVLAGAAEHIVLFAHFGRTAKVNQASLNDIKLDTRLYRLGVRGFISGFRTLVYINLIASRLQTETDRGIRQLVSAD